MRTGKNLTQKEALPRPKYQDFNPRPISRPDVYGVSSQMFVIINSQRTKKSYKNELFLLKIVLFSGFLACCTEQTLGAKLENAND